MGFKAVILMCLLLAGCSRLPFATSAPAVRLLSREQAIAAALQNACMSRPEVSGALVPPQNVQAEQLPFIEAMKRMPGSPSVPARDNPQMPVWVVSMDGLWANEVQAPGVTATQAPNRHFIIVLDAVSGTELESWLRP